MVSEELFDAYQSQGLLPHWIRSQADYYIGYDYLVAVAVKGKGDPNPAVTISEQPLSHVTALGRYTYFYVTADSSGNVAYQWQHKGKDLPGQTDFILTITNVTAEDAGVYRVAVSTGSKPILSKPALLKLDKLVGVRTQPKSQTVTAGKPAVFRVALSGSPPFTYQWYCGTNAIANATKSFYVIPHTASTNAGDYFVIVANPVSSTYTEDAILTVSP